MKTELYITLYSQIKETLIHSYSIQIELGVELLSSNGHQTSLCHVQSNKVCPIEMMYDLSIGSTFSPLSIMSDISSDKLSDWVYANLSSGRTWCPGLCHIRPKFDRTNSLTELMPTCSSGSNMSQDCPSFKKQKFKPKDQPPK